MNRLLDRYLNRLLDLRFKALLWRFLNWLKINLRYRLLILYHDLIQYRLRIKLLNRFCKGLVKRLYYRLWDNILDRCWYRLWDRLINRIVIRILGWLQHELLYRFQGLLLDQVLHRFELGIDLGNWLLLPAIFFHKHFCRLFIKTLFDLLRFYFFSHFFGLGWFYRPWILIGPSRPYVLLILLLPRLLCRHLSGLMT